MHPSIQHLFMQFQIHVWNVYPKSSFGCLRFSNIQNQELSFQSHYISSFSISCGSIPILQVGPSKPCFFFGFSLFCMSSRNLISKCNCISLIAAKCNHFFLPSSYDLVWSTPSLTYTRIILIKPSLSLTWTTPMVFPLVSLFPDWSLIITLNKTDRVMLFKHILGHLTCVRKAFQWHGM